MTSTIIIEQNAKGLQRRSGTSRWIKPVTMWRLIMDAFDVKVTGPKAVAGILIVDGRQESYLAEWCGWSRGEDANKRAAHLTAQGATILGV